MGNINREAWDDFSNKAKTIGKRFDGFYFFGKGVVNYNKNC